MVGEGENDARIKEGRKGKKAEGRKEGKKEGKKEGMKEGIEIERLIWTAYHGGGRVL